MQNDRRRVSVPAGLLPAPIHEVHANREAGAQVISGQPAARLQAERLEAEAPVDAEPQADETKAVRQPETQVGDGRDDRLSRVTFGIRDHPLRAEAEHATQARVGVERRAIGGRAFEVHEHDLAARRRKPKRLAPAEQDRTNTASEVERRTRSQADAARDSLGFETDRDASAACVGRPQRKRIRALHRGRRRGRRTAAAFEHGLTRRDRRRFGGLGVGVGSALGAVQLGLDDVDDLVDQAAASEDLEALTAPLDPGFVGGAHDCRQVRRAVFTLDQQQHPRVELLVGGAPEAWAAVGDVATLGPARRARKLDQRADRESINPRFPSFFRRDPRGAHHAAQFARKARSIEENARPNARVTWLGRLIEQVLDSSLEPRDPSKPRQSGMDQSFLHSALELTTPGQPLESTLARESPDELLALLYRQMRALAGPRQDLDDLVQAAAERALKALERFEGRSSLSTFTYGIVYRTLLDQQRWFRRFQRRFSLDSREEPDELAFPRSSETDLRELQRARRLYAALDQLPKEKRAALILHDLEGLDVSDVAAISGTNQLTVRSRLRDAHKKLAQLLREDPLFDPEVPA